MDENKIRIDCYTAVLPEFKKKHPDAYFEDVSRSARSVFFPPDYVLDEELHRFMRATARHEQWAMDWYYITLEKHFTSDPRAMARVKELADIARSGKTVFLVCGEIDPSMCHRPLVKRLVERELGMETRLTTKPCMILARLLYHMQEKKKGPPLFDGCWINIRVFERLLYDKQYEKRICLFEYTLDLITNEPRLDKGFWELIDELVDHGMISVMIPGNPGSIFADAPHVFLTAFGEHVVKTTRIAFDEIESFIDGF